MCPLVLSLARWMRTASSLSTQRPMSLLCLSPELTQGPPLSPLCYLQLWPSRAISWSKNPSRVEPSDEMRALICVSFISQIPATLWPGFRQAKGHKQWMCVVLNWLVCSNLFHRQRWLITTGKLLLPKQFLQCTNPQGFWNRSSPRSSASSEAGSLASSVGRASLWVFPSTSPLVLPPQFLPAVAQSTCCDVCLYHHTLSS